MPLPALAAVLRNLIATRDELEKSIKQLQRLGGSAMLSLGARDQQGRHGRNEQGTLEGKRASEAVVIALRKAAKPLSTKALLATLLQSGVQIRSARPSASLRSALHRLMKNGVVRRERGAWRLVNPNWSPKPKPGGYHSFLTERLQEGMSMPEAAAAWRRSQVPSDRSTVTRRPENPSDADNKPKKTLRKNKGAA